LDLQHKFLLDITSQIEDIMMDADFDLGTDSVIYKKLKDLIGSVEDYQESLP
jgi:chemotaxis regulatin CheY-phosphate phosphatase CheZ